MFKELILAIALGALLGFGVTGGYLAIKKNQSPPITTIVIISPTPVFVGAGTPPIPSPAPLDTNSSANHINIDSPENETVVTTSQITIKGTSNPGSNLIISTPVDTFYVVADNSGKFSSNVEIENGINQVQIDSVDPNDNQASLQINITYSTAKF